MPWAKGFASWTLSRRCHPAPGPERSASWTPGKGLPLHPAQVLPPCTPAQRQEAMLLTAWLPALRGWCTVVRSGAKGIARYEAGDGIVVRMSTKEASATEAVQRIVEIVVVRLITSDGRRSCRRCDYVQRLQQIAKLNRGAASSSRTMERIVSRRPSSVDDLP